MSNINLPLKNCRSIQARKRMDKNHKMGKMIKMENYNPITLKMK
jgi:hypothetical protein